MKFQKTRMIVTDEQKSFYWLKEYIIIGTRTFNPTFLSNDRKLIDNVGLSIWLDRSKKDWVGLNKKYWPEIQSQEYPCKIGEEYFIAGGTNGFFYPTQIEFFGLNIIK